MKRLVWFVATVAWMIGLAGCKEDTGTPPATGGGGTPASTQPGGVKLGAQGDVHTGARHELGSQTIAGYTVAAVRFGDLKPGEETVVEVTVTGGSGKPKAVRAWVGAENAEGSAKARGVAHENDYDLHVEVPQTLAADSRLWVEVETDAGKPRGSFDLKR